VNTRRKLRAHIARLDAEHKEIHDIYLKVYDSLLTRDVEREEARAVLVVNLAAAGAHVRELADKLNNVEAQLGHWRTSGNSVYRKVARDLTTIIRTPPGEEPLAEWERELLDGAAS